ncbi:FtsK/SpoIIIE domain-containing protein [Bailinhaonella thermotolerans]|uniref:Cell division protein FtsK n=1 Tax=Bailinhaonella thermotolerans TaxID=1070861 RepID=A0A3A4BA15_9ACTN|nr:FtsK/SpoIIIE domain-containing protein [Bailinhaonella thermotolerans]RJL34574.1 cell division protein FtsK [Bailinhaonella thermotolerans]
MLRKLPGDVTRELASTTPNQLMFRPTVVQTPAFFVICATLGRLLRGLVLTVVRHPLICGLLALFAAVWVRVGWQAAVLPASLLVCTLVVWMFADRDGFNRWVGWRLLAFGRWFWLYRRHWQPVMIVTGLGKQYGGREFLPRLVRVRCGPVFDTVTVKMLHGQSAQDWAAKSDHLAHGFTAVSCRVRTAKPGRVELVMPRRDLLGSPIPALPIPETSDLQAVEVGVCEDGTPWRLRVHGTHVLVAGATGAGKGSVQWSIIRGLLPAVRAGLVELWALDPKVMELAYGRALFHRYAATGKECADLLEEAVTAMQARAAKFAGVTRSHTPSKAYPFTLIIVDEVAFLTAYQSDRDLKKRINDALATLTTQGRAVGFGVLAALQDPRKEVMNVRNLFPDKIALRLDEPEQVDMVLGEGARDRGALADAISHNPATGAGVGYVRVETSPEPVRVRAAYVSDADIRAMAEDYAVTGRAA